MMGMGKVQGKASVVDYEWPGQLVGLGTVRVVRWEW